MARKKKVANPENPEPSKPLLVDEDAFTDIIRNLANSPPAPGGFGKYKRKKNPETDPRKIRLFNLDGLHGKKKS